MSKRKTDPRILALVATKPLRRAMLTCDLRGKFTRWKKGQVVFARHLRGSMYSIENKKARRPNSLPLLTSLAGVPRRALKFL